MGESAVLGSADEAGKKEYVGYVWVDDEPGIRLSVWAESATEAGELIDAEFGEGSVHSVWNEEDASRPRSAEEVSEPSGAEHVGSEDVGEVEPPEARPHRRQPGITTTWTMSLRVWCPRCGQGWVQLYDDGSRRPFWVCDECEGVWVRDEIDPSPDDDLETFLRRERGGGGWSSLRLWDAG